MFKRRLLLAAIGLIAFFFAFPSVPARAAEPTVVGIFDGRDDVTGNRVITLVGNGLSAVKAVSLQIDDVTSIGGTALLFKSKTMILFGLPTGLPKGSYIVRLYYGKALTQQDHPMVVGATETWEVTGANNDAVLLSGKAGIGTNQPQGDLHVTGVDGALFEGQSGTGSIPASGPGTRMMWYPGKPAFRAGVVTGAQWDDGNIGIGSTAAGTNTTASGDYSTAFGSLATASGLASTALGSDTTAGGFASTSLGDRTNATGDFSIAAGFQTTAQSAASFVIGAFNVPAGNSTGLVSTDPVLVVGNGTADFLLSNAFTLLRNGNLTIAGTLTQASDARTKTDLAPLSGVLGRLASVHGVSYRFKEGTPAPAGRQIGLLAQEVREAFPELVSEDSEGKLSVAYGNFSAVLLEAVKEQQATIEGQRAVIDAQRKDLDSLEKRLALLEARMAVTTGK